MVKKLLLAAMMMAGVSAFCQDFRVPTLSWNESFPSTFGGIFFSNARRAVYREPKVDLSKYEIVRPVKGYAEMVNVLMLVNVGDTSLGKMKEDALKGIEADDIVNVEIDTVHFNAFIFVHKCEVYMRGVAVKYKNMPRPAK